MALILDKKYPTKEYQVLFWTNRLLRIFPLYWFTLVITVLFTLVKFLLHIGTDDNAITHYIIWSSHVSPFVFGIDLCNFIVRNITLIITLDYFRVNDSTPGYLLIQQAWSLQIELLFYLVAPYIVRLTNKNFLLFLCCYSIVFWGIIRPAHVLEATLLYLFLQYLIYFIFGIISYRYIYKYILLVYQRHFVIQVIFVVYILYILLYSTFFSNNTTSFFQIVDPLYYLLLTLALPYIFLYTKNNKIDAFIGTFSYPVYIMHMLVIKLVTNLSIFQSDSNFRTVFVILLTCIISYIAIRFIEIPVDSYRQNRLMRKKNHFRQHVL